MVMTNPTAIKTALALLRRHPHWHFFPIASAQIAEREADDQIRDFPTMEKMS